MNARSVFELFRDTLKEWTDDRAARLGAALAYYTLFSMAPLLLIAVAIAGLAFGEAAARGQIVQAIQGAIGRDAATVVQELIVNIRTSGSGVVATIIGVVTLVLGASGLFGQLKDALNTIWEVAPKPDRGWRGFVEDRLLSIAMVLAIGFLLTVALAANTLTAALSNVVGEALPGGGWVWQVLSFATSFGMITVLFAMIYRVLPDVKIAWGDVWIGAGFTSLLFTIGIALLGLYLGRSSVASAYGAAGSLVVILIWVYYSAQVFFFGAEFTQVYANKYGSRIVPDEDAVRIVEGIQALPKASSMPESEPAADALTQAAAPEAESAQLESRPRLRRVAVPAATAVAGVLGGILIGLLGPLIGVGGRSKKPDS